MHLEHCKKAEVDLRIGQLEDMTLSLLKELALYENKETKNIITSNQSVENKFIEILKLKLSSKETICFLKILCFYFRRSTDASRKLYEQLELAIFEYIIPENNRIDVNLMNLIYLYKVLYERHRTEKLTIALFYKLEALITSKVVYNKVFAYRLFRKILNDNNSVLSFFIQERDCIHFYYFDEFIKDFITVLSNIQLVKIFLNVPEKQKHLKYFIYSYLQEPYMLIELDLNIIELSHEILFMNLEMDYLFSTRINNKFCPELFLERIVNASLDHNNGHYESCKRMHSEKEDIRLAVEAFNCDKNISKLHDIFYDELLFHFIKYSKTIDLVVLGEFLGKPQNSAYLSMFFNSFNFEGMKILDSIRMLINHVCLPTESQCILRILESFSDKYYQDNQNGLFKTRDNVYTMTYAVILLNTSLHNPSVKSRFSRKEFVDKVYLCGLELEQSFLMDIYNNVKLQKLEVRLSNKVSIQDFMIYNTLVTKKYADICNFRYGVYNINKLCGGCMTYYLEVISATESYKIYEYLEREHININVDQFYRVRLDSFVSGFFNWLSEKILNSSSINNESSRMFLSVFSDIFSQVDKDPEMICQVFCSGLRKIVILLPTITSDRNFQSLVRYSLSYSDVNFEILVKAAILIPELNEFTRMIIHTNCYRIGLLVKFIREVHEYFYLIDEITLQKIIELDDRNSFCDLLCLMPEAKQMSLLVSLSDTNLQFFKDQVLALCIDSILKLNSPVAFQLFISLSKSHDLFTVMRTNNLFSQFIYTENFFMAYVLVSRGVLNNKDLEKELFRREDRKCPFLSKFYADLEFRNKVYFLVQAVCKSRSKNVIKYFIWIFNITSCSLSMFTTILVDNFDILYNKEMLDIGLVAILNKILLKRMLKSLEGELVCEQGCNHIQTMTGARNLIDRLAADYIMPESLYKNYLKLADREISLIDRNMDIIDGKPGVGDDEEYSLSALASETEPNQQIKRAEYFDL